MKNSEILIIGGGVIGASVAYHLTERGAKDVLILERENRLGLGSTGKATGGVRSQFETDININMSLYSIEFFQNWDFDCGYEPRGYLFFATDDWQFDYLKRNVEKQKSLGVKAVEIVDAKTISEIVEGMNCEDVHGGSYGATDGFINPLGVLEGFTKQATANGAKVLTGAEVFSIETRERKVVGVETSRGKIEAEKIVLCSGAWAQSLAKTAGVNLPVEPLKRQIVWARSEKNLPENLPMVIDLGSGFHFRPAKNSLNEILFAYPDADEQPSFDTNFDEAFIAKVYERAEHRAPFLSATEVIRKKCRAGLYENTPDHHAIIGGCKVEGLYFCNGFSGHGVMHSPASGRAIAEIVLDGEASFLDVSCLCLERFASGELLHETAFI
jgi:sarcosine oxidase, subunit beta